MHVVRLKEDLPDAAIYCQRQCFMWLCGVKLDALPSRRSRQHFLTEGQLTLGKFVAWLFGLLRRFPRVDMVFPTFKRENSLLQLG